MLILDHKSVAEHILGLHCDAIFKKYIIFNLSPLMPDEVNKFGGFLVLDFRN